MSVPSQSPINVAAVLAVSVAAAHAYFPAPYIILAVLLRIIDSSAAIQSSSESSAGGGSIVDSSTIGDSSIGGITGGVDYFVGKKTIVPASDGKRSIHERDRVNSARTAKKPEKIRLLLATKQTCYRQYTGAPTPACDFLIARWVGLILVPPHDEARRRPAHGVEVKENISIKKQGLLEQP